MSEQTTMACFNFCGGRAGRVGRPWARFWCSWACWREWTRRGQRGRASNVRWSADGRTAYVEIPVAAELLDLYSRRWMQCRWARFVMVRGRLDMVFSSDPAYPGEVML